MITNDFSNFTIDFTVWQSKLTPKPHFVSYAVSGIGDNALLIGYSSYFGGQRLKSEYRNPRLSTPIRITATLKDTTLLIFENQRLLHREVIPESVNKKTPAGGVWILAQDQDSIGGGFSANQRLIGKICDLRMWDTGFDEFEAIKFFNDPNSIKGKPMFDSPPSYKFEKNNGAF